VPTPSHAVGGGGASAATPRDGAARAASEPALPPVPPTLWARLSKTRILVDTVLPVSVARFFELCVRDGAPFSVGELHARQRAYDLAVGAWAEAGEVPAATVGATSENWLTSGGAGAVSTTAPTASEPLVTRTLRFTMPLEPGPLMPPKTRVEKVQKLGKYASPGYTLIVETSARSLDGAQRRRDALGTLCRLALPPTCSFAPRSPQCPSATTL